MSSLDFPHIKCAHTISPLPVTFRIIFYGGGGVWLLFSLPPGTGRGTLGLHSVRPSVRRSIRPSFRDSVCKKIVRAITF